MIERHPAGVDAEDLAPPALVGHADDDLAIEAAGAAQRLVDCLGAVGRGDHDEIGARLEPVHQRQQLRDDALLRLARYLAALRRDRIDLVDEHDRGRVLGRFLEHAAQPLLALAIGGAHDLRPVDEEELRVALVRHGAGEPRLAGAGRAMEQHALGRLDAQPLEQFGIAQRQLDHLAELVDRGGHAADIVIGDIGAPRVARLLIFGAQLHFGILVDMDDALGRGRYHDEADLLQRIGRGVDELRHVRRHVLHALVAGGRDDIALAQRTVEEGALQCVGRSLQAQILLRRREDDTGRRLRFGAMHLDIVARADAGIGALQTVDANDLQPLVVAIGADRAGGRGFLADDLDDVALGDARRRHEGAREMSDAVPGILRPRVRHLQLACRLATVRHYPISKQPRCGR